MQITFSPDAKGDGPDAVMVVLNRLHGITFKVTRDTSGGRQEFVGTICDVGYHDADSVFVDFKGPTNDDQHYIVVGPDDEYGESLHLEYC